MASNYKSRLPDTPWHIGYALKDENDPRRHKARCIHLQNQICSYFLVECRGSSHCKWYAEDQVQWRKFLEEMKTDEEKAEVDAEVRALQYRKEKRAFVRTQLESGTYHKRYNFLPAMINCPFCLDRMRNLECKFCLAKFKVVKNITDEAIEKAAAEGYFLIKSV